jgi:hypothetical protein
MLNRHCRDGQIIWCRVFAIIEVAQIFLRLLIVIRRLLPLIVLEPVGLKELLDLGTVAQLLGDTFLFLRDDHVIISFHFFHLVDTAPQCFLSFLLAEQRKHISPWLLGLPLHDGVVCIEPEIRRYVQIAHVPVQVDAPSAILVVPAYFELGSADVAQSAVCVGID